MNIRQLEIPSEKGTIAASVHYPEKKTDKLAILCPGFLDSKDYRHLVCLADELCGRGFIVVRFNPLGTWNSGGEIADYTTSQYLKDIRAVLDYMQNQEKFTHVLLGGHSRGGQMSILYAARDSRISMVLGIMPSAGPISGPGREEWERNASKLSERDLPEDENKKIQFNVPFSHVLDRDQYDAVGDVRKIKVPVALVAGELDDIVPPDDVKELFDNANEIKSYVVIPGIGHNYRFIEEEVSIVNKEILKQLELMTS